MTEISPCESLAIRLGLLPTEILLEICAQLCIHCQTAGSGGRDPHTDAAERRGLRIRRSALASLARTSKSFHDIATPYLYHFLYHTAQDRGELLPRLVRTLILRPELAKHVRHVEVDQSNYRGRPPHEMIELFFIAADQHRVRLLDGWFDDTDRTSVVIMELLLLHTPNVDTLHLLEPAVLSDLATRRALGARGFQLPSLKTLTIRHRSCTADRERGMYIDYFPQILRFPQWTSNLTTLYVHKCVSTWDETAPELRDGQNLPGLASITSITFDKCQIPPAHAAFLIRAVRSLKVFTMNYQILRDHIPVTGPPQDPTVIFDALQKHKATLRELTLYDCSINNWPMQPSDDLSPITDFSNLRTVAIGLPMLKGFRTGSVPGTSLPKWLPRSVRKFGVVQRRLASLDVVNLWQLHAAVRRGEFSELKELEVSILGTADKFIDVGPAEMVALGVAWREIEGFRYSFN
ncbi:hypothetical protein B0T14DRAFT_604199 [Immersiella caudata]|uniref:F-box domain-containing protein n=1 Tax=Immersiella caudata TaxID=314043 RepID=A0AA39WS89_9PEZI|nr:hypothetical protein B0T14DRAFT_604199 [Immersiella caudata]